MEFKNIAVIGAGYVGLSYACLLSQKNNVYLVDKDKEKLTSISSGISPINDEGIKEKLSKFYQNIKVSEKIDEKIRHCDLVIFALPTDYNEELNHFDTEILVKCIKEVNLFNKDSVLLIKSTVPVGFTSKISEKINKNIYFSPEFLREGYALEDNLYPNRIIIGGADETAINISHFLKSFCLNDPDTLTISSEAAESIKLFSNTYLALRVAFFNEMDSYCYEKNIDVSDVIKGVSLDKRIGNFYNNPSFGYGGYCLPKDTKQLLANYKDVPQNLIQAIVEANSTRKDFIADAILADIKDKHHKVGIYRLRMKVGSDNIRQSSVQGIIKRLKSKGIKVVIYEPLIKEDQLFESKVIKDKDQFFNECDYIIANRMHDDLNNDTHTIFTRDVFKQD